MAYKIVLTPAAAKDIQKAIDWEESRSKGLGKRFLNDIKQRLQDIAALPTMGTVRYFDVRCVATKVFQYLIHYKSDDITLQVSVLRIWHTKQKPIWD